MLTSRLTQKGQATIPARIRRLFGLKTGDLIAFEVEGDRVVMYPVSPLDLQYAAALGDTLSEWDTPEDEEAWREL